MDKLKEDVSAISKDVAVINVKFETVCTKEELLNVSNNVSLIKKDISGINEKMNDEKTNKRWKTGTSITAIGVSTAVIGFLAGLFIKFTDLYSP